MLGRKRRGMAGIPAPDLRTKMGAPDSAPPPAGQPGSVLLHPTVEPRARRLFEDDPSVLVVEDGVNFQPGGGGCFDADLYGHPEGLSPADARSLGRATPRGVSLYDRFTGEYDLVCRLSDLPGDQWVRLADRSGQPVPFQLFNSTQASKLFVRWDGPALPPRPSYWWPPSYVPPGMLR